MGGVVHSFASVVSTAVKAPVKAVSDIASGKNIATTVGQFGAKAVAVSAAPVASLQAGTVNALGAQNIVKAIPIASNAYDFDQRSVKIAETGNVTRQDALQGTKDAVILGAAAGGVAALGASGALTGAGVASSLSRGNATGALTEAAGAASPYDTSGLADAFGAATGVYNDVKPIASSAPMNLGPYPNYDNPNAYGLAPIASASSASTALVIGAVVLAVFILRRKKLL